MSVFVSVLGLIAVLVGGAGFAFGVTIKEFSFGSTLMITGTMGVVGGLLLIAAGAVIRELHRFGTTLAARPPLRFPPRPGEVPDFARASMIPPRAAPMPPQPAPSPAAPVHEAPLGVPAAAVHEQPLGVPASAVHEPPQRAWKPEPVAAMAGVAAVGATAVGIAAAQAKAQGVAPTETETAEPHDAMPSEAMRDLTEPELAVARALGPAAFEEQPLEDEQRSEDDRRVEDEQTFEHAAHASMPESEPEQSWEDAPLPPPEAQREEEVFEASFQEQKLEPEFEPEREVEPEVEPEFEPEPVFEPQLDAEPREPEEEDSAMADLHEAMEEATAAEPEPEPDERPTERVRVSPFDAIWPPRERAADRHSEPEPEPEPDVASREEDDHGHPPTAEAPDIAPADEPDTTWPRERHVASAADAEPAEAQAASPHPVSILKSGVVDGMGYALYSDGSIEAELPSGTIRFASINELRQHLERTE